MEEHLPPIGAVIHIDDVVYRVMAYPRADWVGVLVIDSVRSDLPIGHYTHVSKTACVEYWKQRFNHYGM